MRWASFCNIFILYVTCCMYIFLPTHLYFGGTMSKSVLPKIPGKPAQEPFNSLIEEYLLSLFQEGYSVCTIRNYGWQLHQFGRWSSSNCFTAPCEIDRSGVRKWGAELRLKYQPQTQKQGVVAVRSFFKWLVKEKICDDNPAEVLRTPKIKIVQQRTLTLSEVSRLLQICPDKPKGIRDQAIIALLVDTGLRVSELCNIKLDDVDFSRKRISIVGKGGDGEVAYFSDICEVYLLRWLEIRSHVAKKGCSHFFVSVGGQTSGQKFTERGLRSNLKQVGIKAGVDGVTPHAFRRSFATIRIKLGQSTRSVQELGRWHDLKTFERYTLALQDDDEFHRRGANQFSPLKAANT
jgi:site-specific recombinase XerD